MNKTIIKTISIIIAAVIVLISVIAFVRTQTGEIASGVYKIKAFDEYPEAYIKIKDDTIQFFNIDLNAIYQDGQMDMYESYAERYPEYALTQEQVSEYSDLNAVFVEQAYVIDYETSGDAKSGTFEYTYFLYPGNNNVQFGLVILYDSIHKTIHINNEIQEITFEK